MTTWRKLLGNNLPDIITVQPDWAVLDIEFDDGYGGAEGPLFLAWSAEKVFFPASYDGAEWVASAPRNPPAELQEHVGGG